MDLGLIEGTRERKSFKTKEEAATYAEQARIRRQNQGTSAFSLSHSEMVDAAKALAILAPNSITLEEAAKYYQIHVLAFRNAPLLGKIVELIVNECSTTTERTI